MATFPSADITSFIFICITQINNLYSLTQFRDKNGGYCQTVTSCSTDTDVQHLHPPYITKPIESYYAKAFTNTDIRMRRIKRHSYLKVRLFHTYTSSLHSYSNSNGTSHDRTQQSARHIGLTDSAIDMKCHCSY